MKPVILTDEAQEMIAKTEIHHIGYTAITIKGDGREMKIRLTDEQIYELNNAAKNNS